MKPSKKISIFTFLLGISALFSGIALLVHILAHRSLLLALCMTTIILLLIIVYVFKSAATDDKLQLVQTLRIGVIAGIVSTITYDLAKFLLSQFDATPFNPFAAIKIFGALLTSFESPEPILYITGTLFHLLNGIAFGVAFCFLFKKGGIIYGIFWGLFLETFQLALYPGWLEITFINEFVRISAISHIVYGVTLGLMKIKLQMHQTTSLKHYK